MKKKKILIKKILKCNKTKKINKNKIKVKINKIQILKYYKTK